MGLKRNRRILHKDIPNFYPSPGIIRVIKSTMRQAIHVSHMVIKTKYEENLHGKKESNRDTWIEMGE